MGGNNCSKFFLKSLFYAILILTALGDRASSTAGILFCFGFLELLYIFTASDSHQNIHAEADERMHRDAVRHSALNGEFLSFMGQAARNGYISAEQWLRLARICNSIKVNTHRALNSLGDPLPPTKVDRFAYNMTKIHDLRKKGILEKECHQELQRLLIDDFEKHTPSPGVVQQYRFVEPTPYEAQPQKPVEVVKTEEKPKEEPVIIEIVEPVKEELEPELKPEPEAKPELDSKPRTEPKPTPTPTPGPRPIATLPQEPIVIEAPKKEIPTPSSIATVVEAFMEEGNVKWIEVIGSLCYLLCFCFGILVLATRWSEFSPVLRYLGLLVLTAFVGLAAILGKVYLGLDQTAHALATVTTIIAPLNMLGANYLFFHDSTFTPGLFAYVVIALALCLVYFLHRWNTKVMLGQESSLFGHGYPLLCLTLLYPLSGGTAALALLAILTAALVTSALSWYAIRELYVGDNTLSFGRGLIVPGSLAWLFFLQAITLTLVNNVTFQIGTWGIFLVLLSLLILTYPARRLCSAAHDEGGEEVSPGFAYFAPGLPISQLYLVFGSFAISILGLLVSCEGGFGGNYPLTLNLILVSLLYGAWALLTGIRGMMGLTTATITGLLLVIRADGNLTGLLSLASIPYLLAAFGYLFCKCRLLLSDDEFEEAIQLVLPFFMVSGGFVLLLTLASFAEPETGRWVTLLFALTGCAISRFVKKRIVWIFTSVEGWLFFIFFATAHLKLDSLGADGILMGLLPILAGLSLIWSIIGYMTKDEWERWPLVEDIGGIDSLNPFSSVAFLSLCCASIGLLFTFSTDASHPITALVLAASLILRRHTIYAPFHEYGVAAFLSYAFTFGAVKNIATTDEHWLTSCAVLSLVFTMAAYFLQEETKRYHGEESRHPFADVGLLWFLPPNFYLLCSPFWHMESKCVVLSASSLIAAAFLVSRLYKFWPHLYTTPLFLLITLDCCLLGGLGHFGRGLCLSFFAVFIMVLSRMPRLRVLTARESRKQGLTVRAKPLAELNLVFVTLLFFAFALPLSLYRLAGHQSTAFTTLFSFSTSNNGPFWPLACTTLLLIGAAYIGMARHFFFRDLLATIGWSIITVGFLGQLTRLLPTGSLTRWYPFVVIAWAWALQSAWTQWPKTSKWAARRISLAISLYGFFILGYSRFVVDGSLRAEYAGLWAALLLVTPFALAAASATGLFYFLANERKNAAYSLLIALSVVFFFTFLSAAFCPGPRVWGEAWGLLFSGVLLSLLAIRDHQFSKAIFILFGLGLIVLSAACGLSWELHVATAKLAPLSLIFFCWLACWIQHRYEPSILTHNCIGHGLLLFLCHFTYVVAHHLGYTIFDYWVQMTALFALIVAALANLWTALEEARLNDKNDSPWLTCWNAVTLNSFARTYAFVAIACSLSFLVTTFQTFDFLGFKQFLSAVITTFILLLSIRPVSDKRTAYLFNALLNWTALCTACGVTIFAARGLGYGRKYVLACLAAGATLSAMTRLWKHLRDRATSKEGYTGKKFLGLDKVGLDVTADATIWVSFFFAACAFVATLADGCQNGFVLQALATTLVIASAAHYRRTTIMSVAMWLSAGWTSITLLWSAIYVIGGHHLCVTHGSVPETTLALTALFVTILSFLSNWAGRKLRESDDDLLKEWLDCDIMQYLPYLALIGSVSTAFTVSINLGSRPHVSIWLPSLLTLIGTAIFLGFAAHRKQRQELAYLTLSIGGVIYGFLRLSHLIGVTFWGQLALVVASFALLGASHFTKERGLGIFSEPCYNISLVLPLFLVMRAGFGFGQVEWLGAPALERFSLIAMAAAFYGLLGREKVWASGLSMILGNFALAVLWSAHFGLNDGARYLEFYTVPAGLTLMLFARIHREWMEKEQAANLRLGGLLIVYAAPTWHCCGSVVTMYHFYALFSLGLLGFLTGMGLRIRHFFIYGLIFMVIALCSLLLNIVSIRLSTFAVAFFFLLAVAFFTHAALLRHYRDRYKELLNDFATWE